MTNSLDFKGKVAIVTGASSGIGEGIAKYLAELGAQVVITGRNAANLNRVAKVCQTISPKGLKALEVVADITRDEDVQRLVDTTIGAFNKLDILVNNAGQSWTTSIYDPNVVQNYENVMNLDLRSVIQLTQLAVPYLERSGGNIINISSIVALKPIGPFFAYCMAKSTLDMFTKCLSLELGPKGIRVNSINSGAVKSNFLAAIGFTEDMVRVQEESLKQSSPLGLYGTPQDIAHVVAYLASDDASYVTGVNFSADGGAYLSDLRIVDQ
ncbi:3-oxoacyl-[acyl-carrier-protein] reductase FabG-like [Oppia nitens]|uniref:3-oxoacyl-[acyl-carrier-protein] reductase FabG-like n=1 Tax=Oppia nitens TaxID=1686743 RepID=UPI0023DCD5D9|nr:3-oxoacyl-[acyl-carrier-protein] reductase FabG-like [Oppia nitens]